MAPIRTQPQKRLNEGPLASPTRSTRRSQLSSSSVNLVAAPPLDVESATHTDTNDVLAGVVDDTGETSQSPRVVTLDTSQSRPSEHAAAAWLNLTEAFRNGVGATSSAEVSTSDVGVDGKNGGGTSTWPAGLPGHLDRETMDAMDILVGPPGLAVEDASRRLAETTGVNLPNDPHVLATSSSIPKLDGVGDEVSTDVSLKTVKQMALSNILPVPEPSVDEHLEMAWIEVSIKKQDDPTDSGACTDIWAPILVEEWGVESEAGYLLAGWPDNRLVEDRALIMMSATSQGRPRRYLGLFSNFRIRGHPDARRRVSLQAVPPGTQRALHRVHLEWTPTPEVAEPQVTSNLTSANNSTGNTLVMTVPDLQLSYTQNMSGRPDFGFGPVANRPAWAFWQTIEAISRFSDQKIACPEIRGHRLSGLIPKKTLIAGCGVSYSKFREHVIIFERAKESTDSAIERVLSGEDKEMLMGEFLRVMGPGADAKTPRMKRDRPAAPTTTAAVSANTRKSFAFDVNVGTNGIDDDEHVNGSGGRGGLKDVLTQGDGSESGVIGLDPGLSDQVIAPELVDT